MMNLKMRLTRGALVGAIAATAACGGGNNTAGPTTPTRGTDAGPTTAAGTTVNDDAQKQFAAAIDSLTQHDKAADWNDQTCGDVAKMFDDATSKQGGKFAESSYDAGLAYQRCGDDKDAKGKFQDALTADPNFQAAKVQLTLYTYKADGNKDAAIQSLQDTVVAAQYHNINALVSLATVQMERDGQSTIKDCPTDMECAKKNLQRALAIDDAYMPALNQLGLYYFKLAKERATGGKPTSKVATNASIQKRADVQQLELASLVCTQAEIKNPNYAPIHNTAGLIDNELGLVNLAVQEFQTAAKLDSRFFEAQMNFAAINLSFRGFDKAQTAYQNALKMQPNSYEAHLGLALALRGLINDSNYDAQVAAVQAELDAAKKVDANRPDAYFNEGILTQEYKTKAATDKAKQNAAFVAAKSTFQTFIQKANGKSEYDGAVKKANERIEDCDAAIALFGSP